MEAKLAEVRLIADVCSIASKPFVEAVENHFAGYFNELGIHVKLAPEASDEEVIALQNELLSFFDSTRERRPAGFTWKALFSREGKNLKALFPGDPPRSTSADLEWSE